MGVVASFQLRRADGRMAKTLVFVKCAFTGDVARLQEIMARDKVSPNAQDRFGMTALHWAAYGGKLACVQALIKAGASVAIVDANGRNALHHACRKDHDEVVKYLVIDAKVDANARTESKDTPLHKAAIGKSIRCVELLLQLGANPTLRNDQNRTALEELDSDPRVVKDVLPKPIATARIQEELDNWRQEFITEVTSSERRRASLEMLLTPKSRRVTLESTDPSKMPVTSTNNAKKYASSANMSVRDGDKTLVTTFRARISEFSDRTSSAGDLSVGSRPSSAHFVTKSQWAQPSGAANAAGSSGSSASDSHASTGRRDSLPGKGAVVLPLNLEGLRPAPAIGTSTPASDTSRSPQSSTSRSHADGQASRQPFKSKNLRYAGKRVIMALRVKKVLTGDEKVEVIRLMLQRHMKMLKDGPNNVLPIGNPLTSVVDTEAPVTGNQRELIRATSGVKLSMPPNF